MEFNCILYISEKVGVFGSCEGQSTVKLASKVGSLGNFRELVRMSRIFNDVFPKMECVT